MAHCKVKREVEVTLVMNENEAAVVATLLSVCSGDKREIVALRNLLSSQGIVGLPQLQRPKGASLSWSEDVPF